MKSHASSRYPILSAILLIFVSASLLCAQTGKPAPAPQAKPAAAQSKPAATGQKVTVEGVIVKRDPDSFTLRDTHGATMVVSLTNSTVVKEKKSNPFRRGENYAVTQLLRGLSVEVTGRQSGASQIAAVVLTS